MHAQLSSGARCLGFVLNLHLLPYFVYASSKGSGQNFFISFRKVEKENTLYMGFFPPTLNNICFVEKKLRSCLCIFESDMLKVIVLSRFLGKR